LDSLDQELARRNDNMMADIERLSALWAAAIVAFVIIS
jgi:hypothetical protein